MSANTTSRWANDEEDAALETQRKREKEEKKRAKLEKQRKLEEASKRQQEEDRVAKYGANGTNSDIQEPFSKRRRLSSETTERELTKPAAIKLLRFPAPEWGPCRSVENYEKLNHIEEGTYGWVSRAREIATGEIVALKKLKMDEGMRNDGFPVTGLREIQTLQASRHPHIVKLREVVMGEGISNVYLVMDFLEHDLKSLQEDMSEPFLPSEIKTLLLQLTSAINYLHSHWIMHRDLKTSNILMNNRGQLKIADFGMARYYGDPPPPLTQLVVTLWYRAPELLLGAETYGPEIDIWSLGCIFGELLTKKPLLPGKNEANQLIKIFELCGLPTTQSWPSFRRLPNAKALRLPPAPPTPPVNPLRAQFPFLTTAGSSLLASLLSLNPATRPTAAQILAHPYFKEDPRPKSTAMFPTFPSKAGQEKRRKAASPSAPQRGDVVKLGMGDLDFTGIFGKGEDGGAGFSLRMV